VKRFLQRGLVLLGASAISLGLASPALAANPKATPGSVVQEQSADVSNSTEQKAVAFAPAVQVAPAANVGVLNFGGQSIKQANSNSSNAVAGNWNSTSQSVDQSQSAVASGSRRSGGSASQEQSADVSNSTEQKAVAFAPAVQVAPAANVGVLNFGRQSIKQANSNSSNAQATNVNATSQSVAQRQSAEAAGSHVKHPGKSGKHDRKVGKHGRKGKHDRKVGKHGRKVGRHDCKPARHDHLRKPNDSVSQRQDADLSNRTEQKAVALAPAVQVAPALNVGVLNFGGQSIHQANSNSGKAGASNVNSTDQEVSQSQLGDA